jgi:hypothetical protein
MADYTSNFAALLTGHLGLPGDPTKKPGTVDETANTIPARGNYDNMFDARDILTNFVGKGYKNFSDPQAKSDYAVLKNAVGEDMAKKLATQAFIFNSREDMKGKSWQEKISSFYSIGSNDPAVAKTLNAYSNLGQGPIAGANSSANAGNEEVTGRKAVDKPSSKTTVAGNELSSIVSKKIGE